MLILENVTEKRGALVLIIGNSGSGKDSLIQWVRKNWPSTLSPPLVPTRFITRPPSPETEDFKSISEQEFQTLSQSGAFQLRWRSYGINYGVSKDIETSLMQGRVVLVNVSRQVVEPARQKIPNVYVVFIKVPFHITEARIRARGREEGTDLEARIERARQNQDFPTADYLIDNSGDLESAGKELLNILLKISS